MRSVAMFLVFAASVCPGRAADVALVGGTVINVGARGTATNDLRDATVLLHDRLIVAVGRRDVVAVPVGATVIDVSGQFIVPGFIDGFAAQRNQSQANAHLAMGVTTIVGLSDERRGLLSDAAPGPHIKKLEAVYGYDESALEGPWTTEGELRARGRRLGAAELESYVRVKAWEGYSVLLLMYPLDLKQIEAIVAAARRHHLATIGELGFASYVDAARAGVNAFVHLNRIATELAPPGLRRELAEDPFPGNSSVLRMHFESFLADLNATRADVRKYAHELASAGSALLPTAALFVAGSDLDRHNPWNSEIGPLIDARDVHLPLDPATGAQPVLGQMSPELHEADVRRTQALLRMQAAFVTAGVPYLAASGTTAFGVLPGDGMHWEMKLLTEIGLTPRQALAAATDNYSAIFGWKDRGRVAPGRLADIVVLRKNPTLDIDNTREIARVYLAGEELDRSALLQPGVR